MQLAFNRAGQSTSKPDGQASCGVVPLQKFGLLNWAGSLGLLQQLMTVCVRLQMFELAGTQLSKL